jgi:hypothetical protein
MYVAESQSKQKCRVKQSCSYPAVEQRLYQWMDEHNLHDIKVTDKQIRDQAREECLRIYNREWKPSNGWLIGFKARMKKKDMQPDEPILDHDHGFSFNEIEVKGQGPSRWVERIKVRNYSLVMHCCAEP